MPRATAAPPNDQRTSPQALNLPARVTGSTAESTLEADEPGGCAPLKGSVWYQVQAADTTRIVVRLAAQGDLDASIDVFRRVRSQLSSVACDLSDDKGDAELTFRPEKGGTYLIRVGQRANSVAGQFRLDVFAPEPPPAPPGSALPARGATRTLDAVQNTADAWAFSMRAGTTYRINLAEDAETCVSLALYPPGTKSFDDDTPVRRARCGGYLVYTPGAGEGGRYGLLLSAQSRRRGAQRYHLQAARAGADDTAPGLTLANYQQAHGALRGSGVDAVDLYRFSLARRSDLKVTLRGGSFALQLLDDTGRRLDASGEGELERQVHPGRYFIAVRAAAGENGRYVVQRAARTITRTSISMPGRVVPGRGVPVSVRLGPPVSGPVQVTVERFDPLAGWQFFSRRTVGASGGRAALTFLPTGEGRWRATAAFRGTRSAAPSRAGYARTLVARPLGT